MKDHTEGGHKRKLDNGDAHPPADIFSSTSFSVKATKEMVSATHFGLGARPN